MLSVDNYRNIVQEEGASDQTFTKRCLRCKKIYTDSNCACNFHSGKIAGPWFSRRYECCNRFENTENPCKTSGRHLEDMTYTNSLSSFPVIVNYNAETLTTNTSTTTKTTVVQPAKAEPKKAPASPVVTQKPREEMTEEELAEEKLKEEYYLHPVSTTDTLTGLSLKYRCPEALIKKVNKLTFNEQLWGKKTCLIPKISANRNLDFVVPPETEVQIKSRKLSNLKQRIGHMDADRLELCFYLEDADWNVELALNHFLDDRKWEYEQKQINQEKEESRRRIEEYRNVYKSATSNSSKKAATQSLLSDFDQL